MCNMIVILIFLTLTSVMFVCILRIIRRPLLSRPLGRVVRGTAVLGAVSSLLR